jgi:uncharacterized protein
LTKQILAATTTKRLEDLYLPFKPKKQTLATTARSRGLEELAREILEANPLCANLDARAADYASVERQVPTGADALLGAGHILAEQFSENAEVRQRLREIMQRTGVVASTRIAPEPKPATAATSEKTEKPMPKAKASSPRDSQTASPDQITLETIVAVEADGQSMENSTATAASTSEAIHSVDSLTAEPAENVPVETGALPDATAEETHTGEAIATEHAAIESGTAVSEHAIAPPGGGGGGAPRARAPPRAAGRFGGRRIGPCSRDGRTGRERKHRRFAAGGRFA